MKQQYFITLVFSFLFLSCTSFRFKELEIEQAQTLKGSVKEIKIRKEYFNFRLDLKERDTVSLTEEYTFIYDKNNKPIKQIEKYPKGKVENIFSYNRDSSLKSEIAHYPQYVLKQTYKYDNKKNDIEYAQFENDSLVFKKSKKHDSKNNPVEISYYYPRSNKSNSKVMFLYDYKSKSAICKMYDNKGKEVDYYLKYNYDKKGNVIRSQTIFYNSNNPSPNYSVSEYDNSNNLIKLTVIESGRTRITNFINKYDKIGNIVTTEKTSEGKLFMTTNYQITYY